MAQYRLETQVFSRGNKQSAVAKAAYRSGEKLFSITDQCTKYYPKKNDEKVQYTSILSPAHAPEWTQDREYLWNEVEIYERDKNKRFKTAQLAREVLLSLPRELGLESNIELAREFVQQQFVDQGMVADLAIHEKPASDGGINIHAHVMLTLREISMDGFGKKNRDWNSKAALRTWRKEWQEAVNDALEDAGETARVSHESLAARGIDREPQPKLGPNVAAMDARSIETVKMDRWHAHRENALSEALKPPDDETIAELELLLLLTEEEKNRIDQENNQR